VNQTEADSCSDPYSIVYTLHALHATINAFLRSAFYAALSEILNRICDGAAVMIYGNPIGWAVFGTCRHYLHQGGYVFIGVCLSVSRITQKLLKRFSQNSWKSGKAHGPRKKRL